MTNILLKQFSQGRIKSIFTEYIKIFGHKNPKVIDQVIPAVSTNLFQSTESFIEAVINLDKDFVEQTATLAVQKKLISAMDDAKRSHIEIKAVPFKTKLEQKLKIDKKDEQSGDIKRFAISPYVIFGQNMNERFKSLTPWEGTAPILGLNRYLYINPLEGISWQKITNDHVYGFHCHYQNINKGYQIIEGTKVTDYSPQQFVVTFETDAVNQEFFVADFNYIVKYGK